VMPSSIIITVYWLLSSIIMVTSHDDFDNFINIVECLSFYAIFRSTQPCIPPWSLILETTFGWGKGGKVTTSGWQLTLCDPMWHVTFHTSVVISITNCYILVYFLY